MKVSDLTINLCLDLEKWTKWAALEERLEAVRDRAIAFEHARICAGLVWPYRVKAPPVSWLDRARKMGLAK